MRVAGCRRFSPTFKLQGTVAHVTVVPGMGEGGRGHAQQQAVSPGGVTRVTESGRFGVIRGRWLKQKVLFLGHHDSREDGARAGGGGVWRRNSRKHRQREKVSLPCLTRETRLVSNKEKWGGMTAKAVCDAPDRCGSMGNSDVHGNKLRAFVGCCCLVGVSKGRVSVSFRINWRWLRRGRTVHLLQQGLLQKGDEKEGKKERKKKPETRKGGRGGAYNLGR